MAKNRADKYTDKTFGQLESQISRMYKEAQKDINQKLLDFTKRHRAKDRDMKRKLKKGEITQEQYDSWLTGQVFIGDQWRQKKEQIAESIKSVMQEASNVSRGKAIDVFAENANYTAFEIEKDLGAQINFGLYDAHTVSRLIRDEPELLPRKVVNDRKLEAWNQKVIANSISQGIIQGESIDEISKRIARDTCISAGRSSTLYARTAVTGAQNAGRIERLHEAKDMGINVKKRWMATLDNRTRDSHAELDGETIDVDEKFSNGLMYPGDPSGDPSEVYNCRCTMVYVYPEYEQHFERTAYYEEGDPEYDPNHRNYETVRDMTYQQWTEYKQNQTEREHDEQYQTESPELETPRDKFYDSHGLRELGSDADLVYEELRNSVSKDDFVFNDYLIDNYGFTQKELERMWEDYKSLELTDIDKQLTISKTPEELVKQLKKIEIDEDWFYQPEPGQEGDMRENLIPFVGAGKDMELDGKLDFGYGTTTVSTRDDVEVRISDLKTLQPMVDVNGVERALHDQAGMGHPVKVVEYNGQMYVLDGNHRVNAAILRGDETIDVQLIKKVDKQPVPPKPAEPVKTTAVSTDQFVPALDKAKASCPEDKAWRVDTSRTAEDFRNDRITTYITEGGSTFALKDDGDIISVCKNQFDDSGTNARSLLAAAVEAGGTHLDSFDGNYGFYVKCGFEPVSRCRFDEEYAPPGWIKGRDNPEDIYFMRYVGVNNVKYRTLDEARANVPYSSGYDEAEAIIKKVVRSK